MKLIANENFQYQGMHRSGVTLTVPETVLKKEIERGRHPQERRGRHPWMSGLLEHCTPANQKTADFIEKNAGKKVGPKLEKSDIEDDSEEIRAIRAEFDLLGKGYDKRWQIKRLRDEIVKARKEVGIQKEDKIEKETPIKE